MERPARPIRAGTGFTATLAMLVDPEASVSRAFEEFMYLGSAGNLRRENWRGDARLRAA